MNQPGSPHPSSPEAPGKLRRVPGKKLALGVFAVAAVSPLAVGVVQAVGKGSTSEPCEALAAAAAAPDGDDRSDLRGFDFDGPGTVTLTPHPPPVPGDVPLIEIDPGDLEILEYPIMSAEMLDAAEAVETRWGSDPRYNTIEISEDRTELIVWWHAASDVPAELADSAVPIRVERTPELPGDLRAALSGLLSHLWVSAVWEPKEGDAVAVMLNADAAKNGVSIADIEQTLAAEAGVPVRIDGFGGPMMPIPMTTAPPAPGQAAPKASSAPCG